MREVGDDLGMSADAQGDPVQQHGGGHGDDDRADQDRQHGDRRLRVGEGKIGRGAYTHRQTPRPGGRVPWVPCP